MRYNSKLSKYTNNEGIVYPEKSQKLLELGVKEELCQHYIVLLCMLLFMLVLAPLQYVVITLYANKRELLDAYKDVLQAIRTILK